MKRDLLELKNLMVLQLVKVSNKLPTYQVDLSFFFKLAFPHGLPCTLLVASSWNFVHSFHSKCPENSLSHFSSVWRAQQFSTQRIGSTNSFISCRVYICLFNLHFFFKTFLFHLKVWQLFPMPFSKKICIVYSWFQILNRKQLLRKYW